MNKYNYLITLIFFYIRRVLIAHFALAGMAATSFAIDADKTARAVAGIHLELKSFNKEEQDLWRAASREIGQYWSAYEKRIAVPMRQWSCQELASAESKTVFYPFSGPDLPSVALLHPDANRFVMVAMQRAGRPPDLEALSQDQLAEYLTLLRRAWKSYGVLGYFRTDDLEADRKSPGIRLGVTGILMAFAARLGYTVQRVESIDLDANGNVVPLTLTEAKVTPSAWRSVRLHLNRDRKITLVDYLSMDLADQSLSKNEPARLAIARFAGYPTLLKAASHLPQKPYFSIVRDHLLTKAPSIVQDETGIEYNALVENFGAVKLYGKFVAPNRVFHSGWQPALAAAYKDESKAHPLPFKLGYEKRAGSAVQVAMRQTLPAQTRKTCPTLE